MNDLPNSNKFKDDLKKDGLTRSELVKEGINTLDELKSKKAVRGAVKVRKPSKADKVKGMFISEDVNKVKDYVVNDVLVPSIKDAISSIIKNGIDIILFGEAGRRDSRSRADKVSYRDYNSISRNGNDRERDYRSSYSKGTYDYDTIIFETKYDAESVLMQLDDVLAKYRIVRVADYYEFADVTADHAAQNYGWTDLRNASIAKVRDGWVIRLPRPMPID